MLIKNGKRCKMFSGHALHATFESPLFGFLRDELEIPHIYMNLVPMAERQQWQPSCLPHLGSWLLLLCCCWSLHSGQACRRRGI